MKLYGLKINAFDVFQYCQAFTKRRVLLSADPNHSQSSINYAYAMSEDDEKYFFKIYFQRSCQRAERLVFRLAEKLMFNGIKADESTSFKYQYIYPLKDNKSSGAVFFAYASENFPASAVISLIEEYLQWDVLYYWYWEKNLKEELGIISEARDNCKKELNNILSRYANQEEMVVPYNDGFTINPTFDKIPAEGMQIQIIESNQDYNNQAGENNNQGIFTQEFNEIFN